MTYFPSASLARRLALLLVMVGLATSAQSSLAQPFPRIVGDIDVGLHGGVPLPLGTLADDSRLGFDIGGTVEYALNSRITSILSVTRSGFTEKDLDEFTDINGRVVQSGDREIRGNRTTWGVLAGGRFYVSPKRAKRLPYIGLRVGVMRENYQIIENDQEGELLSTIEERTDNYLAFAPEVGMRITRALDISAAYHLFDGTGFLSVRLGLALPVRSW